MRDGLHTEISANSPEVEEEKRRLAAKVADAALAALGMDIGQSATLTLWCVLTGNPNFMLSPAIAALNAGKTTFEIHPGAGDTVKDMDTLAGILQGTTPTGAFSKELIQSNVLNLLTLPVAKLPGFSSPKTAADVFLNACALFQLFKQDYVSAWDPPCPHKMNEIPVLNG